MLVQFTPINYQYNNKNIQRQQVRISNLAPLSHDTVSFGAMKKHKFEGIDLAVVEKFKAPIEKFNSNADLQNWAGEKAKAIAEKDFGGRSQETQIQRKAMLKEWSDYVFNENDAYSNTTALLILNAVTKNLEQDNDNIPPVLNKGVLADCIYEIDKNTHNVPKYQFDLNKMYQNKLRAFYLDDIETDTGETATKWVVIPSKKHDPENFEANVGKLKTLSYKTWCTKSNNAKPYLAEGDFHVYLENGKPKLGVRFVGDEIQEIQGELNNGRIPFDYLAVMQKHIDDNNLKLTNKAKEEIETAQKVQNEFKKIKAELKDAIENNNVKTIYNYFGIDVKEDKDGYLTISEYRQPSIDYTFKDLGIDENKLFEKVKTINGSADFSNSQITDLGNLETINGNAYFSNSQITDLGNLRTINGDAYFSNSQITDLGNLETINGKADFFCSQVTDLGNLKTINGPAQFFLSQVTNLGNLEIIGGHANFSDSPITDLGNLEKINGDADFNYSQVTDLGNLETINGDADFRHSQVTDLGNLEIIGGDADFSDSQVTNLGNLKKIDGNAYFRNSQITDLGNLEIIGGDALFVDSQVTNLDNLKKISGGAYFHYSQVTNLGNLEIIGGHANFSDSPITDLGNLEKINGDADFNYSQVTDLGNLETINGDADFRDSKITDLGNLEIIGGDAYFRDSKITDLGNLETIGGDADFRDSLVTDLGNLKTINGKVNIHNSQLTAEDFKNIKVKGTVFTN